MLRLASDADVHGDIIRGLFRRAPGLDLVRAQDALPERTADSEVLAWAAAENRVLITNDRNTMVGFACHRVASGDPMTGLIVTTNRQAIGPAIDDILLIAEQMTEEEIRDQKKRPKWEFKTAGEGQAMHQLGEQGWELVAVSTIGGSDRLYFKRPK